MRSHEPEKAIELLTLIALLHNCHKTNIHQNIHFFPGDIIITPRDGNDLPTGLHFDLSIEFPQCHPFSFDMILPTVNYIAKDVRNTETTCKCPHIELAQWGDIISKLDYRFQKQTIRNILGNKEFKHNTFPKYDGPDYVLNIPKEIIWERGMSKILWGNGKRSFELQELLNDYEYSFDFNNQ